MRREGASDPSRGPAGSRSRIGRCGPRPRRRRSGGVRPPTIVPLGNAAFPFRVAPSPREMPASYPTIPVIRKLRAEPSKQAAPDARLSTIRQSEHVPPLGPALPLFGIQLPNRGLVTMAWGPVSLDYPSADMGQRRILSHTSVLVTPSTVKRAVSLFIVTAMVLIGFSGWGLTQRLT